MLQRTWPAEGLTRVPYWVYQDADIYQREQERIFRGATWSYLCLEAELPEPQSFLTSFVGDMPVVVARDADGAIHAFENRCAHRGALIAMQARGKRVMIKPVKVLGAYTQVLPNNWKLYMDNVKDTYHASLLHLFFTRFRINRLTQEGGVFVSKDGAHHCTFTRMIEDQGDAYEKDGMRSAGSGGFKLEAPELLEQEGELGDAGSIQILSLFPRVVLHPNRNSLAAPHVLPQSNDRTELHWTLFCFAGHDEGKNPRPPVPAE